MKKIASAMVTIVFQLSQWSFAGSYPGYASNPEYSSNPGYTSYPGYASNPEYSSNPGYTSYPGYASNPEYSSNPGYASYPGYASNPEYSSNPGYDDESVSYTHFNPTYNDDLVLADSPEEAKLAPQSRLNRRAMRAQLACQLIYDLKRATSFRTKSPTKLPANFVEFDSQSQSVKTFRSTKESPLLPENIRYFSELTCTNK